MDRPNDESVENEEENYEVQRILEDTICETAVKRLYRTQWKGWNESQEDIN